MLHIDGDEDLAAVQIYKADTRAAMTAESTEGLRSADRRGRRPRSRGSAATGARDRQTAVAARKRRAAMRSSRRLAGPPASGIADACGPGSPDSHRVVWGLTSRPPVPPRAFLRFPVCPPGSPPSPAFPWFPFVRRSPVRPLRPLPGFRVPFGVPPGSLPLSKLHDSAAGARFRRHWSRAARAKVTSPAATTLAWISP